MLAVMFPGQAYPRHYHIHKDESFHILYGDLTVEIAGKEHALRKGDLISINRGISHSFHTQQGVIIEEIATTYLQGDSVYEDEIIAKNPNRKIFLTCWPEWIED
jgi:N-acetylneuraminate synthase